MNINSMEVAMKDLSEWAARELPDGRRDEPYLRRFLFGCKMRQDTARSKMKHFYRLQEETPQWFRGRDPTLPQLAHLLHLGVFLPLPDKDEFGRTIIVVKATVNNPRTHPMTDVFKVGMMVLDLAMEDDESISRNGVVVLIDLHNVSMFHAPQMTPTLIRRAVHSWQDCYPVKIKGIHFMNCPFHVLACLSLFKKFMREKLQQRVHIYGRNLSKLKENVSPQLLPTEYGGELDSLNDTAQHWNRYTRAQRDWFLAQEANLDRR